MPIYTRITREIFIQCYEITMTRCFGWSLPTTMLCPFADFLNHNPNASTHYLVNISLEKDENAPENYAKKFNKTDLSLFKEFGLEKPNENLSDRFFYITRNRIKYLEKNIDFLSKEDAAVINSKKFTEEDIRNIQFRLNESLVRQDEKKQIWDFYWYDSSDGEDNDSDVNDSISSSSGEKKSSNDSEIEEEEGENEDEGEDEEDEGEYDDEEEDEDEEADDDGEDENIKANEGIQEEDNSGLIEKEKPLKDKFEESKSDNKARDSKIKILRLKKRKAKKIKTSQNENQQAKAEKTQMKIEYDQDEIEKTKYQKKLEFAEFLKHEDTSDEIANSFEKKFMSDFYSGIFNYEDHDALITWQINRLKKKNLDNKSMLDIIKSYKSFEMVKDLDQLNVENMTSPDFFKDLIRVTKAEIIKKYTDVIKKKDAEQKKFDNNEDETWDWYSVRDNSNYFVISSDSYLGYKKGEQIFICYGRRTNRFLLLWYGFCILDNKYDSYSFELQNAKQENQYVETSGDKVMEMQSYEDVLKNKGLKPKTMKEIRLKGKRFCEEFLSYLRTQLLWDYKGDDLHEIIVTKPTSLQYEELVLDYALKILIEIRKIHKTTTEEDTAILEDLTISAKKRFAVVLRRNHKIILDRQIGLIKIVQNIIQGLKAGKPLKECYLTRLEGVEKEEEVFLNRKYMYRYLQYISLKHN